MKPLLTILTNTIPPKRSLILLLARLVKRLLTGKRPLIDKYEGHAAVTRSLLSGLKNLKVSYNYNPQTVEELATTVHVLSDLRALRQGIELKKQGIIKKLYAGPVLTIDPNDEKELLSSSAIDGYVVPCNWVRDFYVQEIPELKAKCGVWPVGVDMNTWKPDRAQKKGKNVLIYSKLDHLGIIEEYKKYLNENGWNTPIIRYGFYNQDQYLKMLNEAELTLFFSDSETQGIALLESWATNVPTLVWNRGWAFLKQSQRKITASSAPYLGDGLGYFFSDINSFKKAFEKWEKEKNLMNPRNLVYARFSDESCAQNLLKILGLS